MQTPPRPESSVLKFNPVQEPDAAQSASISSSLMSRKEITWSGLATLNSLLNESPDGFEPLRWTFVELWSCVEQFEKSAAVNEEYGYLRAAIDSLCFDISRYIGGATLPPMTPTTANLSKSIKAEAAMILQKTRVNATEHDARTSGNVGELIGCYRRIQELLTKLAFNLDMSIWQSVKPDSKGDWIKNLPNSLTAGYDFSLPNTLGRNRLAPGTRIGVLHSLSDWAQDSNSRKIYWLNGMAGTGKTTIAYSLCEQLERNDKLAASFFCSRMLPECRDVNWILPTIAYQLSLFSYPFRHAISTALEQDPGLPHHAIVRQFENLIVSPLRRVSHTLPADLVIVIDALDECDDTDDLGRLLSAFLEADLPMKLFVTSRPKPHILDQMETEQGESARCELRLHELEHPTVQSDIKTYIRIELGGLELDAAVLETLVERSGVLFIFASAIVRYVKQNNLVQSNQRLDQALATFEYQEIDSLYTAILEAAFENSSLSSSEGEEMQLILRTVICAHEPLSISLIAGLFGLDDVQSVSLTLRSLLSVLHISSTTGLVTTLHKSFSDYLLDEKRSGKFSCNAQRHHDWFSQACFNRIKAPSPPFNICNLESSYILDRDIPNLYHKLDRAIPQYLVYASKNWGNHIMLAATSETLLNQLYEFLSTRLLLWMEIMNLKEEIHTAAGMLFKIRTWMQCVQPSTQLCDLVDDAWRFVTAFTTSPMKQTTPHIYISGLTFWPKERPVSRHYSGTITGLATTVGLVAHRRNIIPIAILEAPQEIGCVTYSPDGANIVFGSKDGTIHTLDAYTTQTIGQPLEGHVDYVFSVAFSPTGTHFASGSSDGTVRIWDTYAAKPLGQPLEGHTDVVYSVAYSPDGAYIASGSWDGTICVWDAFNGKMIGQPLAGPAGSVNSVEFSPAGDRLASGDVNGTVCIWDRYTGEMMGQPLKAHSESVFAVRFSPDGLRFATCSSDKTIRIWDAYTGTMLGKPLEGHTAAVRSVAYSPDGIYIVSGSLDQTIRVWDVHTGQLVGAPLEGHSDVINSLAYSPDGARIASGSSDKTIRVWDVRNYQLQSQALGSAEDDESSPLEDIAPIDKSADNTSSSARPDPTGGLCAL
ncbi:hypothetical protein FRC12_014820 [Ceratobasidium sp. 428]|nr:hypothetical protein FRC12_014820 [Ceratobasidium sp. 428]